jgi:effector-binding domain-containing protein
MVELKRIEAGKLLCLETKGSLLNVAEPFQQLIDYTQGRKVPVKGDRMVIVYDAPETLNREQAHYAATVELSGDCNGDGDVTVVVQSNMQVAYECFQGPYEGLSDVYQRITSWIHDKGFQVAGPSREFYLVGPPEDSASYLTEVQIPIQRSAAGNSSET